MEHPPGDEPASDPLWKVVENIHQGQTPQERLQRAQDAMASIQALEIQIKEIRRQAVIALHETQHWSLQQIADLVGVSKGRIRQIVVDYDPPTRPGVMEHNIRIAAAATKAGDRQHRAREIFSAVQGIKGIESLSPHSWEAFTDIPSDVWQEILPGSD